MIAEVKQGPQQKDKFINVLTIKLATKFEKEALQVFPLTDEIQGCNFHLVNKETLLFALRKDFIIDPIQVTVALFRATLYC